MPSSTPVKLWGRHHERPPSVSSLPHPHKGRLLLACCPTKPPDLGAGNPWPDTRASGFHDEDLAVLQEQFVAGPRTYGWAGGFGGPGLTIYRFQRPGQRVWVATHPEQTEWWLGADSAGSLAALTDLLARANQTNQALVEELRRGWVWTGSDWMQPTVAATKPDNHPR